MIKTVSAFFIACAFFVLSFAQSPQDKTVITGKEMEIKKSGDVIVSRGDSKAVSGRNIIKSDEMTYDKKKSLVTAAGNVRLFSKTDEGEPVEAYGGFAKYYTDTDKGKLWGKGTKIKYHMKSSEKPLLLKAGEIYIDKNLETLSAYIDVEVITSSGVIYSDNAVFDKKSDRVIMEKDKKRPVADVIYDERKGLYEADTMIFYNADDNKKIVMKGDVTGKIQMEDRIPGIEDKSSKAKKGVQDKK